MKAIFLQWHLGLGDAILCNGMVRFLAKEYDEVILPAKNRNVSTVTWMFSDVPQVTVLPVREDREMLEMVRSRFKIITCSIGVWSRYGLEMPWAESLYAHAKVPFECRWSEFKLPWKPLHNFGVEFPAFVHDDPKRGYNIDQTKLPPCSCVYIPNPKDPFSKHVQLMHTAMEIHVIDSCFLCLADSIETCAKRHVLHLYATAHDPYKKFGPPTLRKNWEILR